MKSLCLLLLPALAFASVAPKEIMLRSEHARQIRELTSSCRLVEKSGGETRAKTFRWWRKLADNGVDYRTLVRFLSPATVRDEGILILENDGGDNQVLLYLPAYKKIRRVENQQQTGRFMGSEFSYSDIATAHVGDYTYTGGTLARCPKDSLARGKCYVVESRPANQRVSERTGYSRIVNWVRSDNFMLAKAEFYDSDGKLYKRLISWGLKPAGAEKGKWISLNARITNLRSGASSTIEFTNVKVDPGIPNSTFTEQNLSAE